MWMGRCCNHRPSQVHDRTSSLSLLFAHTEPTKLEHLGCQEDRFWMTLLQVQDQLGYHSWLQYLIKAREWTCLMWIQERPEKNTKLIFLTLKTVNAHHRASMCCCCCCGCGCCCCRRKVTQVMRWRSFATPAARRCWNLGLWWTKHRYSKPWRYDGYR